MRAIADVACAWGVGFVGFERYCSNGTVVWTPCSKCVCFAGGSLRWTGSGPLCAGARVSEDGIAFVVVAACFRCSGLQLRCGEMGGENRRAAEHVSMVLDYVRCRCAFRVAQQLHCGSFMRYLEMFWLVVIQPIFSR